MSVLNRDRWRLIEPLLDQALELSVAERASWLDALRTTSPGLAADLSSLLDDDVASERRGFLMAPVEISLAGMVVGAYTLERPLGHGGMGSVWLARRTDGRFDGTAAVKLLNLSLSTASGQERFRREGSMLARLTHSGIARLLDAGVSPAGQPYLVLENVDGQRIDEYMAARGLAIPERVRLFLQVLDAVGHAHANLVIHRDLKPSNILITREEVVKLLDFGIAKLLDDDSESDLLTITTEGARVFTPEFAAPEQVSGQPITTATDVYALGVLLYLLVSGRHPTSGGCRTPADAIQALLQVQPARLGMGDLETVLRKALRKVPRERYQTVGALGADLRHWLRNEPVSVRADSLTYRGRLLVRRHRLAVAGAAAGAALAVTYVTMVVMDRARVRDALAEATASAHKAEQVTDFAVGMFDAGGARGTVDSLSARELLTRGVARAHELAGQPATEAQMLDLIGRIRMEIGDYAEAGPVLREALEIRRRTLGENHADVATSLMNNAALLGAMDRDDTSGVPMLRRALAIRQQLFGAADPRSTDALYQLASGLHMAGQYRVARPQFDEWMRLVATQRPQLTPERAEQLGTLASIMEFSHQLRRADTLRREVLALDRMLYGERHYRVAADLSQIGGLQLDLGDPLAADTLLRQAVALLRANYPDGHPQLAHALRNYGYLLVNEGRWPEADTVWRESAASYRQFTGAQSLGYANSMTFVGLTQVMRGHAVEAEHTLRAVLASNAGQRPSPNPVENRARLFLGKALLEQGRMTEAEPLLLDGFRVASASSASPAGLRLAAQSLVTLYTSEGRTAEAAKYRQAASDSGGTGKRTGKSNGKSN